MKKALLTFGLACISLAAVGQSGRSEKGIISLLGGNAVPTGDFGDKSRVNRDAAYAKTGRLSSGAYDYFFNNNFGIGILLACTVNNVDVLEMAKFYSESGVKNVTLLSEPYSSGYLLINGVGKFPITPKLIGYGKFGIGVAASKLPEMDLQVDSVTTHRDDVTTTAGAVGLGFGMRYQFGKFGLGLEILALNTNPEFVVNGQKMALHVSTVSAGLTLNYVFK